MNKLKRVCPKMDPRLIPREIAIASGVISKNCTISFQLLLYLQKIVDI